MPCLSGSKPVKKTLLKRWQAHIIWFILYLFLGQPEKYFPGNQKNIFSQEFIFGSARKKFQPGVYFWGSPKNIFVATGRLILSVLSSIYFWGSPRNVFLAARKTFSAKGICFRGSQNDIFSQEYIFGAAETCFSGSQEFIFGATRKMFFWQPGIYFWGSRKNILS
jgi:hypothetical protein